MATENDKDAIQRRDEALDLARRFGQSQEIHHQAWVIDQMCRVLLGDEYEAWVADAKAGEDGPDTYRWDTGIAP
jgi:hypothetical protein